MVAADSPAQDAEKRDSLVGLRSRYDEASKLVTADPEHSSNLDWILGGRRNPGQNPLGMEKTTIEAMALWLQDLASEMDRRRASTPGQTDQTDEVTLAATRSLESAAAKLREATDRFLLAFRHEP